MSATWFRLLLCLSLTLVSTGQAFAQTRATDEATRAASARTLFEQGLAEADGENWSEAATLFERALSLRDSPVIRFNLSAAWIELNRLVEASELLRVLESDARANVELRASASKRRESLERRLASLTIVVDGQASGAEVLLDEKLVAPAQLGSAFPVDPRLHRLVLRLPDRVLDEEQVGLGEGEARSVHLQAVAPPVLVATPAPLRVRTFPVSSSRADEAESPPDGRQERRRRRLFWGLGTAAVAVAAGVVAGVLLASRDAAGSSSAFSPGSVSVRVPQ